MPVMNTDKLNQIVASIYSNEIKAQEQNNQPQQQKQKIIDFIKK